MKKLIKQISNWYFGGFCRKKLRLFPFLRFLLWGFGLFFCISFLHEFWFRLRFPGPVPEIAFALLTGIALMGLVRFAWNLPEPASGKPDRLSTILAGLDAGLFFDLLLTPLFLKLAASHPLILLCCFAPAPVTALILFLRHPMHTGNGLKSPVLFLFFELLFVFYFFLWVKVTGLRLSSPGT